MALDESFAEAWLNENHKILGIQLKPFSLWHRFLLGVTGSRVTTNDQVNLYDVLGFLKVCSNSYPNRQYELTKFDHLRIIWYRKSAADVSDQVEVYIKDHCAYPEFWDKNEKQGKTTGGPPDPLSTIISLMNLGFTESQAWDMPIGMAQYYSGAYIQQQGADIEFITSEERELFDQLRKEKDSEPGEDNKVNWDEALKPPVAKKHSADEQEFLKAKFGNKAQTGLTPEEFDKFNSNLRKSPSAKYEDN